MDIRAPFHFRNAAVRAILGNFDSLVRREVYEFGGLKRKKGVERRSANSILRPELFLSRATGGRKRGSRFNKNKKYIYIYMEKNEEGVDDDPFESITFYLNFHCSLMETQRAAQPRQWCFARVERGRGGTLYRFPRSSRLVYYASRALPLPRDKSARCSRRQSLSPPRLFASRRSFHRPFRNFGG